MRIVSLLLPILFASLTAQAKNVRTLVLSDDTVAVVPISFRGTILNFPTKPIKVIIGSSGAFNIEYIGNDVVISPTMSNSRANVFVYLEGRRFNIDATAKPNGYTIVQIRDRIEKSVEIKYERK